MGDQAKRNYRLNPYFDIDLGRVRSQQLAMITDSTDHCIPAEEKVTNTTAEDDREDHKTIGLHNQQHDNVGGSKLDSEDQCANELLFVGQVEQHVSRGRW